MPNLIGKNFLWLREMPTNTITGTVPNSSPLRTYVNEAPNGQNPDSLFLMIPPDTEEYHYEATIDGSRVDVFVNDSTTPPPGTVHITDAEQGELYFAAEDSGKAFTFKYQWVKKYHSTEAV